MRTTIAETSVTALRRVLNSCVERCRMTREKPSILMVPNQVMIRSNFLGKSASNAEMSAVRSFLGSLTLEEPHPIRDAIIRDFPWSEPASLRVLADAISYATRTPSEYAAVSSYEISSIKASPLSTFHEGVSNEDCLRNVSGVRREAAIKVVNRKNASLLERDYRNFLMNLSGDPVDVAMRNLASGRSPTDGVCSALISALYLTGIRPIEAWSLDVLVPSSDLIITDEGRDLIRRSPSNAARSGIMRHIRDEAKATGQGRGRALLNAIRDAGAPAIISVKTAKQKNANPHLACPYRFMILEGISEKDADLLSWASDFSLTDCSQTARRRVIEATERRMSLIAFASPEMRRDINPYTFRHSFASRMRGFLDDASCAALTGHTAIRTFKGYGEKGGSGSGGGWRPTPDPERARMITEVWSGQVPSRDLMVSALNEEPAKVVGEVEIPEGIAAVKPDRIRIVMAPREAPAENDFDAIPSPSPWR